MINYIGGIKRSYDYAKVRGADNEDEYQAAMVILMESVPGRSFWITRDAIWKYIEPSDNREDRTISSDRLEFQQILDRHAFARKTAVTPIQRQQVVGEAGCIIFAMAFNATEKIMLCTAYNLGKCMQMFGITPVPQAAAQLLMWIQDGLDHLKNMPDDPPAAEEKRTIGEVTLFDGGTKIGTKDIQITESEAVIDSVEA